MGLPGDVIIVSYTTGEAEHKYCPGEIKSEKKSLLRKVLRIK